MVALGPDLQVLDGRPGAPIPRVSANRIEYQVIADCDQISKREEGRARQPGARGIRQWQSVAPNHSDAFVVKLVTDDRSSCGRVWGANTDT